MNFIPIAIVAYALNAGSILVAKAQLNSSIPNPLSYAFLSGVLQLVALLAIPFGFNMDFSLNVVILSLASGITFVLATLFLMQSIKDNEASVAGPVIGGLNPLFALILGSLLLNQALTNGQTISILILIAGAGVLTASYWIRKLVFDKRLLVLIASGFLYGLSYIFLREVFLQTSFINGMVLSRLAAGLFSIGLLVVPNFRDQIFRKPQGGGGAKQTGIIFLAGQLMGGVSSFLIFYAVSLANSSLVNSFFGVQYLVILIAAVLLAKKAPKLLDEKLTSLTIFQKIAGAVIMSVGLYLLAT